MFEEVDGRCKSGTLRKGRTGVGSRIEDEAVAVRHTERASMRSIACYEPIIFIR